LGMGSDEPMDHTGLAVLTHALDSIKKRSWACHSTPARGRADGKHLNHITTMRVQPFVRSLRIFVSGALPRLPFYSRRLLPTAELGGCSAACSLPLLHLLMLDMPDWGRNTRIPLLPCYTLRVARYALRGTA
jgi:hypothetical protein